jgi:hypothetical protein
VLAGQRTKSLLSFAAKKKLWQGCGKNPDFTTKTDIMTFDSPAIFGWPGRTVSVQLCETSRFHPHTSKIHPFLCRWENRNAIITQNNVPICIERVTMRRAIQVGDSLELLSEFEQIRD